MPSTGAWDGWEQIISVSIPRALHRWRFFKTNRPEQIDVLQIHRLDRETPPEEIMRALHDVVAAGKVRYLGASSMYAWEFARLQYTARMHGVSSLRHPTPNTRLFSFFFFLLQTFY
jgi:predicted oxidoreductase